MEHIKLIFTKLELSCLIELCNDFDSIIGSGGVFSDVFKSDNDNSVDDYWIKYTTEINNLLKRNRINETNKNKKTAMIFNSDEIDSFINIIDEADSMVPHCNHPWKRYVKNIDKMLKRNGYSR